MTDIPEITFGPVREEPFDWRSFPDEPDPDDEDIGPAPGWLIAVLGVDPDALE